MTAQTLFWGGLFVGLYPYLIYPLIAQVLARLLRRRVRTSAITPRVSILISAYNEAKVIEGTILNKLAQDYAGRVEILVASDESTDGTDEIVQALCTKYPQVYLYRQEKRAGKTAALNELVKKATGEILVFADANSLYETDTLSKLIARFADPEVGYVTGSMVYVNEDGSLIGDGCSTYMRYENHLRRIETSLGSVVGVDGGVDAVRARLYHTMRADQLPDFVLPLSVVAQGYRVVYAPDAVLKEESLSAGASEFRMRVRVSLRALWALKDNLRLLFGGSTLLFAWQLWSHKLLRYLSFAPLSAALVASGVLAHQGSTLYSCLYAAYLGVLALAWLGARGYAFPPARYAYYFALLNAASALATFRFLCGKKQVLWQPRVG